MYILAYNYLGLISEIYMQFALKSDQTMLRFDNFYTFRKNVDDATDVAYSKQIAQNLAMTSLTFLVLLYP